MKDNSITKRFLSFPNIALLGSGGLIFLINSWTIKNKLGFLFDDVLWVWRARFYNTIITILPTKRYNDRPLRNIFFEILYHAFGLQYNWYYLALILLHIINTYLVYLLANKTQALACSKLNESNIRLKSIVIAVFFGMYPKNLMAVFWIAGAANDSLCAFFSLLAMLSYFHYMEKRTKYISLLSSVFFYFCSMRSKEAAIALPIIIILFDAYCSYIKKEKFRFQIGYFAQLTYLVAYMIKWISLEPYKTTSAGNYWQDFSLFTIIKVLLNYIRMYFALDSGSFAYDLNNHPTKVGDYGIILCGLIILVILIHIIRKSKIKECVEMLLLGSMILLSMSPLLVLPNTQHLLYLYFPAIFLSMFFGSCIYSFIEFLCRLIKCKYDGQISVLLVLVMLVILNNVGGAVRIRNNFTQWGNDSRSAVADMQQMEQLPENSHVYWEVQITGPSILTTGPDRMIQTLQNDMSITAEYVTENTVYEKPYVIWRYTQGHVTEIKRVLE